MPNCGSQIILCHLPIRFDTYEGCSHLCSYCFVQRKADVSVNIYAFLKAQETNKPVELFCAIGDEYVDGKPYTEIVKIAHEYVQGLGGFEKFAEWGLF